MKPQTFLFVTSWLMVIGLSIFEVIGKDTPKSFVFYFGFFLFFTLIGFALSYEGKPNEHSDRPTKTK